MSVHLKRFSRQSTAQSIMILQCSMLVCTDEQCLCLVMSPAQIHVFVLQCVITKNANKFLDYNIYLLECIKWPFWLANSDILRVGYKKHV